MSNINLTSILIQITYKLHVEYVYVIQMYDQGEDIVTMNIRKNANMIEEKGRYSSIDKFNGSPGLAHWGYVETEENVTRTE